jgi:hypothetical protein
MKNRIQLIFFFQCLEPGRGKVLIGFKCGVGIKIRIVGLYFVEWFL